jgi:hypothetical protein
VARMALVALALQGAGRGRLQERRRLALVPLRLGTFYPRTGL